MLIKFLFLALIANLVYCCIETSTLTKDSKGGNKDNKTEIKDGSNDSLITNLNRTKELLDASQSEINEIISETKNKIKTYISNAVNEKPLLCYYGSWAVYRPGDGKFNVEDIDPHVCTHLIFAFAGLSYNNEIVSLDSWNDLPDNYGKNAFGRFTNLKKKNEKLKTLLAIGGWNEGSVKYSNMVKSEESRKTFVKSVVQMLEKYNFDGLDLDWEYPANRGGIAADKANHAKLIAELKEAFAPKGLLLTAAVGAGTWIIDSAYDVPAISKYLDFINVMTYDLHGPWDGKTGHNSPLYARSDESGDQAKLNVNFAIKYWISKGAAKEKLILGMGTYGKSFTLSNPQQHNYSAPITGPGAAGQYTREPGTLGYNEICEDQVKSSNKWTIVQDDQGKVPYAFRGNQWVGFDDIASVNLKARYAYENGLGGAMIWSIETDDFRGNCGQGKFPLLASIRKGLNNQVVENPDESSTPTSPSTPSSPTTVTPSSSTTVTPSSSPNITTSTTFSTTDPSSITDLSSNSTNPSTSTSSSSTPQNPDKLFKCKEEGFFKSESNCAVFYRCVFVGDFGDGSKYRLFKYECPYGTVFDDITDLCVWPSAVKGCEHFWDQKN